MPLVEVIQAEGTDPANIERVMALLRRLGKVPVHVRKDVPGFVGNRLQHALWREAIALVANGVCDAETVDLVVKNSFGRRLAVLGPLENADLVGTDLVQDIHNNVLADLDASPTPQPLSGCPCARRQTRLQIQPGFQDVDGRQEELAQGRRTRPSEEDRRTAWQIGRTTCQSSPSIAADCSRPPVPWSPPPPSCGLPAPPHRTRPSRSVSSARKPAPSPASARPTATFSRASTRPSLGASTTTARRSPSRSSPRTRSRTRTARPKWLPS